jgi:hypothetical protein
MGMIRMKEHKKYHINKKSLKFPRIDDQQVEGLSEARQTLTESLR